MPRAYDKGPIIATALLLASVACLRVVYPEPGRPIRTAEGEVLAFGRIAVIDRDHEIEPWKSDLRDALFTGEKPEIKLSLFLIEANRRAIYVRIEPEGSFFWVLPAGTYLLYHSRVDRQPPNEPLAAFQITAEAHALYLGTMTMDIESNENRSTGKQDYEVMAVRITDELEQAKQVLEGRYPEPGRPAARKLMISDPSLRSLFQDYSKRTCERILEQHGLHLLGPGSVQRE